LRVSGCCGMIPADFEAQSRLSGGSCRQDKRGAQRSWNTRQPGRLPGWVLLARRVHRCQWEEGPTPGEARCSRPFV